MITFKEGNLLNSNCNVICHQVNCMGTMGAGIAKQIKDRWPDVSQAYREFCTHILLTTYNRKNLLGMCFLSSADDQHIIANIFSQYDYGRRNSNACYTEYDALDKALDNLKSQLVDMYSKEGIRKLTIGFPYNFGCGLAGGNWDTVLIILHKHFDGYDWNVEIWKLPEFTNLNLQLELIRC